MSTEPRPPANDPARRGVDDTAHLDPVPEQPATPPPAPPPPAVPSGGTPAPAPAAGDEPRTRVAAGPAPDPNPPAAAAMGAAPAGGYAAPPPPGPGGGWGYTPGGPRPPWPGRVSGRTGLALGLAALLIACICGGLGLVVGVAVSDGFDRHHHDRGYYYDGDYRERRGPDRRPGDAPWPEERRRVPRQPERAPNQPVPPAPATPAPTAPPASPTG